VGRRGRSDMDERVRESREKSFRRMVGRLVHGGVMSGGAFRMKTEPSQFYQGDAAMPLVMADLNIVRQLDNRGHLQRLVIEHDETDEQGL
jgi:hypothetical protein